MIKIIPTTKEQIKKFNLFGCDVSIGLAVYAFRTATSKAIYTTGIGWHSQPINYLIDYNEEDGIITHRFILWRVKIEVKTVVQYDFKFA